MQNTDNFADAIKEHIPHYLTVEHKRAIASAFLKFPDEKNYYLTALYGNEMLQGDCWTNLQLLRFETGERKRVRGLILSNTCDITQDNKRDIGPNVVFSPIVRLSKYIRLLERNGVNNERIKEKIIAIKAQAMTTIFYLPDAIGGLGDEYIAILDDVHTVPAACIKIGEENIKGFTLNNFGFYMFIFKLSIHFCRLRENVMRAA